MTTEYFTECHWGQCLELLCHLCQYSDQILLVTGSEGIGKTTMKQALMDQEADQYVFCEVQGSANLTSEQLYARIEDDVEAMQDKDLLLVIDDAQFLALDVLAMILQLKQKMAVDGRFHIVLFATADLEQKISRSVLKQDFAEQVHTIDVEPLSLSEVEPFLRQQWRQKYKNNDMPFERAKCKKIYALSGGIPGRILEVVEEIMTGKTQTSHTLSPFAVGVTVSFGVLFCILAILWPSADKSIITKTENLAEHSLQIAKNETPEEELAAASLPEEALETKVVEVDHVLDPNPVVELASAAPVVQSMQNVNLPVANMPVATTASESIAEPETFEQKIAKLEKKVNDLQQQIEQEIKAHKTTEAKLQQLLSKQPSLAHNNKKASVKKEAGKKELAKKGGNKSILNIAKQEKHILALPENYYTIQLLCMNHEDQVKDFINKNNLHGKANYYKSHIKGKDRYTVVYGSFANKTDAQLALSKLPTELKKLQPLTREYASIQYSINNRGK